MAPVLSVVVVHYNAPACLRACLGALPSAAGKVPYETIVVDNASRGLGELPSEFPQARWLLNRENVGWGAAVNQAAAKARGDILVLLNPDAEPLPGALEAVSAFLQERGEAPLGPVGGRLLFSDGSVQPSCGPFLGLGSMLWRLALPPARRKGYLRPVGDAPRRVDWVSGAFLAVRRSVFERLGGFDPGFFLYYEDTDFCRRAGQAGFPAYYLPQAAAYHHNPHALRQGRDPKLERIIADSRLRYFRKHRPRWESWLLESLSA